VNCPILDFCKNFYGFTQEIDNAILTTASESTSLQNDIKALSIQFLKKLSETEFDKQRELSTEIKDKIVSFRNNIEELNHDISYTRISKFRKIITQIQTEIKDFESVEEEKIKLQRKKALEEAQTVEEQERVKRLERQNSFKVQDEVRNLCDRFNALLATNQVSGLNELESILNDIDSKLILLKLNPDESEKISFKIRCITRDIKYLITVFESRIYKEAIEQAFTGIQKELEQKCQRILTLLSEGKEQELKNQSSNLEETSLTELELSLPVKESSNNEDTQLQETIKKVKTTIQEIKEFFTAKIDK
jgi:hypothetical protein